MNRDRRGLHAFGVVDQEVVHLTNPAHPGMSGRAARDGVEPEADTMPMPVTARIPATR
jgi:hypothetical protein